jgi:hypothetical protein
MIRATALCLILSAAFPAALRPQAAEADLRAALEKQILDPRQPLLEVQVYTASRVPMLPVFPSAAGWQTYAADLRQRILDEVVLRGEAKRWRDAKTRVEWLETLPGGPGYRVRKLRYEAVPGLWSPALLYEPAKLSGKVPVILNVNGHEKEGIATPYIQERCINLAKRGMLALNVEWFGRGQMTAENFHHYRMNQVDLCGTSGVALHYLSMKRAIDLLLGHQNADPARLAVTGLSGGSWQTIVISSLDTRVRLANPVAGYSSYVTRAQFPDLDLGDSEQAMTDLGKVADYVHLTALLAPRPALLTYNAKDSCCFRADYAVGPLLHAARPIFRLLGVPDNLRYHINHDEGHNYGQDNREAFYRMLRDHFFKGDPGFPVDEIPSKSEVKTAEQVLVELPGDNSDFHSIAQALSQELPRDPKLPSGKISAPAWQKAARAKLAQIVRASRLPVDARDAGSEQQGDVQVKYWRLKMGEAWTVPAVELARGNPQSAVLLAGDAGRAALAGQVGQALAEGRRAVVIDPFYFGESKIAVKDYLFALQLSAVGDRPLGLQASQVAAAARWLRDGRKAESVTVRAFGPRASLFALVAAALEPRAIAALELHDSMSTLKEVIEQNLSADKVPDLFCFGLLESFDIRQLVGLVAPRPARFVNAGARATSELAGLRELYSALGAQFDPLKPGRW